MASNNVNVGGGIVKGRKIVLGCQWASHVDYFVTFCYLTTSLIKGQMVRNYGGII